MGIKNLNRYLQSTCQDAIQSITIVDITGKTIAVDISIYMHYFDGDDALMEKLFVMLTAFHTHQVRPIFVFDGKPPQEKMATIAQRKLTRHNAQRAYSELLAETGQSAMHSFEAKALKRQTSHLTQEKIANAKTLIHAFGMQIVLAPGEADEVCAYMAAHDLVWAVLSDDTDMFTYGCSRVLRYLALDSRQLHLTSMSLVTTSVIHSLIAGGITSREFTEICVASGSDYCAGVQPIHRIVEQFGRYKEYVTTATSKCIMSFHAWLILKAMPMDADTKLSHEDARQLLVSMNCALKLYTNNNSREQIKDAITRETAHHSGDYNLNKIKDILGSHGFILPCTQPS